MKSTLVHPRTGLLLVPLGYRRNGAPIWPILGAAENDGDQGDAGAGTGTDGNDGEGQGDGSEGDGTGTGTDGEDSLGDAGKKALDAMKAERNAAKKEARDLKAKLDEALKPKPAEGELPDPDALREEGRRAALEQANQRVIRSEVKAAATGKLADPADALQFLDLTSFEVDDDGNVDTQDLADAIDELLRTKPYLSAQGGRRFQGSGDGGSRNGKAPTLDEQIAEATKAGNTRLMISLKSQQLADLASKS